MAPRAMLAPIAMCLVATTAAFTPGGSSSHPSKRPAVSSKTPFMRRPDDESRLPVWFEVEKDPEIPEVSCYQKSDGSTWCAWDADLMCGTHQEDSY